MQDYGNSETNDRDDGYVAAAFSSSSPFVTAAAAAESIADTSAASIALAGAAVSADIDAAFAAVQYSGCCCCNADVEPWKRSISETPTGMGTLAMDLGPG